MLQHNALSEKAGQRFSYLFSTLKIGQLLRSAGIHKESDLSSLEIFKLIFTLVFQGRNLFRLLHSQRGAALPGKDVMYRFLNHPRYRWRKFLHSLSFSIIQRFEKLTSVGRVRVFIVDDSILQRNRSKKVELLARVYDHVTGRFVRGFSMLTLGWSDGYSFAPIDFVMLSSAKAENRYAPIQDVDKRTHGYKRRMEAFLRKPDAVVQIVERALQAGFTADYVLMDSWFTQAPLLRALTAKGLHVIGMVKAMKQRYIVDGQPLSLQELYTRLPKQPRSAILGSLITRTTCGLPVKLVFVRNRNGRRDWLALLSTDLSLEDTEMVRIYGNRWGIETFFKFAKTHLKLGTEFQGRSFDMLISHTTIVFARYLLLEWERRHHCDDRSLGGLFYLYSDEVQDMDLKTALKQLFIFVFELLKVEHEVERTSLFGQLHNWIKDLPSYIKALLPNLGCES